MRSLTALCLLSFLSCAASQEVQRATPVATIEVTVGDHDRHDPVVSVELPDGMEGNRLFEVTGGRYIPTDCQIDAGPPRRLVWVLAGENPAGTVRRFELANRPVTTEEQTMTVVDQAGKHLEVRFRGQPVLRYNNGIVRSPDPEVPEIQARNGYIHPVWAPSGNLVTDDYNPDHLHQRGIWFAWVNTEFEGRTPDFWNLHRESGTVRHQAVEARHEGPVFGGFRVRHQHMDLSAPGGEKAALREIWDLKVYAAGGPGEGFFLFDVVSRQQCAGDQPLRMPEYRYGGMALRAAREWTPEIVQILNSEGSGRQDGDGVRATWCAIGGPIGSTVSGMAVLGHPDNFRAPQPVRIHPEMPYFAFSPMRLGEMAINPGETYVSRYRFIAFDGAIDRSVMEAHWRDYAEPPTARIIQP